MCEVVVELDSHMCIVGDDTRLGAMLTLTSSRATAGLRLQDFMLPEDAAMFEARMQQVVLDGDMPPDTEDDAPMSKTGALHVKMRDSLNNVLNVEIFYVQSSFGPPGQLQYLV